MSCFNEDETPKAIRDIGKRLFFSWFCWHVSLGAFAVGLTGAEGFWHILFVLFVIWPVELGRFLAAVLAHG